MTRTKIGFVLKQCDSFKQPVSMFIHCKEPGTGRATNHYRLGTKLGGVTTLCIYMIISGYFLGQVVTMFSTSQDLIQKQIKANTF